MRLVKGLAKILAVLVGVVIIMAVVGVVILMTTDFNQYKDDITAAVTDATGRHFAIDGDLTVVPSLTPTVAAEGLRLANASWGSQPQMIEADRVFVSMALLPLFQGEMRVNEIRLVGADVLLETDAEGRGNWRFGETKAPASESEPAEPEARPDGTDIDLPAIVLSDLGIEDAILTYRDGQTGQTRTISLDRFTLAMVAADSPLTIALDGGLDDLPISLSGEVGSLTAALGNKAFPVSLEGTAGPARFTVNGTFAQPQAAAGIDVTAKVEGDQLAALADLIKVATGDAPAIPALGAYRVQTTLAGDPAALSIPRLDLQLGSAETLLLTVTGAISDPTSLQGIALRVEALAKDRALLADLAGAQVGALAPVSVAANVAGSLAEIKISDLSLTGAGSDVAGDVTVTPLARPIALSAALTSRQLDLRPFQGAETGSDGANTGANGKSRGQQGSGRVFSDDPLPLDGFKTANADVRWSIDKIATTTATLTETTVTLSLKDGVLRLAPVRTALSGGSLTADLTLNAAQAGPAILDAKLDGTQFALARLLAETPSADTLTGGPMTIAIDLNGSGRSLHQIAASLNGLFQIQVGEAMIANPYLDIIAGDVLNNILELVDPFQKEQKHTNLHCGVVRLPIRNGIAMVDQSIAIQTSKIAVVADGQLDLGAETLDLAVHPYPLEGVTLSVGQIAKLLRLQGSFLSPTIGANVESIGKTALSVGAAIATQGGSLALESVLDQFSKDPDPCATAMGRPSAARKAEPPAVTDPGRAVESVRETVEQRARDAEQEVKRQVEERAKEVVPEELRRVLPGGLLGNW